MRSFLTWAAAYDLPFDIPICAWGVKMLWKGWGRRVIVRPSSMDAVEKDHL